MVLERNKAAQSLDIRLGKLGFRQPSRSKSADRRSRFCAVSNRRASQNLGQAAVPVARVGFLPHNSRQTKAALRDGFKIAIVKWTGDANAVTVARSSTNTINGATSVTIGAQYSSTIFVADFETNQWFAASSGLGTSNISVDAFSGDNSTVAFTLSADPGSENNTQVYVSGVYQEKDTYSVSGTTLTY